MDFEYGKLLDVARQHRPNRRREYAILIGLIVVTSVPYVGAFVWRPFATLCVVGFTAYFQVLMTFATSTATDTAHAIRFLLAGSNPIGMCGASSLMFGAVDAIIDWREDTGERRRNPGKFWALIIYKLAMTPIGAVLMLTEYLWDAIPMRRPGLIRHKWRELFSLANYHDLICPEKSNDIFYADLAVSRYQSDPMRYQWNRMRAMVFELQHYRIDAENGVGVPETNLFLQSEVSAYQTLKRLKIEEIEAAIATHYQDNVDDFPFPKSVANRLIQNARPLSHYLTMRQELLPKRVYLSEFDRELSELLRENADGVYRTWLLLKLLDHPTPLVTDERSNHVDENRLNDLEDVGVLRRKALSEFEFDDRFMDQLAPLVQRHYLLISGQQSEAARNARTPNVLDVFGDEYVPVIHSSANR